MRSRISNLQDIISEMDEMIVDLVDVNGISFSCSLDDIYHSLCVVIKDIVHLTVDGKVEYMVDFNYLESKIKTIYRDLKM